MSKGSKSRITNRTQYRANFDLIDWGPDTKNHHYTIDLPNGATAQVTSTPFFPNSNLQKILAGEEPLPDRKDALWPEDEEKP